MWKDKIKKQSPLDGLPEDFGKCLGIVIQGIRNSDVFEYMETDMLSENDLINLLNELDETVEALAESEYDRRSAFDRINRG